MNSGKNIVRNSWNDFLRNFWRDFPSNSRRKLCRFLKIYWRTSIRFLEWLQERLSYKFQLKSFKKYLEKILKKLFECIFESSSQICEKSPGKVSQETPGVIFWRDSSRFFKETSKASEGTILGNFEQTSSERIFQGTWEGFSYETPEVISWGTPEGISQEIYKLNICWRMSSQNS